MRRIDHRPGHECAIASRHARRRPSRSRWMACGVALLAQVPALAGISLPAPDGADAPAEAPLSRPPSDETSVPGDAEASVATRLAFSALLEPGGIERPHWRSFEHAAPSPRAASRDPANFLVVIDPGHGGSDPGARGPNGLLEKHLTLDIARRVRLFLSEIDGIDVVLTRERDHGLSRLNRVSAVRRSEADLFVSLHFNHLPQSGITLVESFYASPENIVESRERRRARSDAEMPGALRRTAADPLPDLLFTRGSARFAHLAQRRVYDEVGRDNGEALDAGVKEHTLYMLTRSFTAGALVELTCLSNAEEAERLTDESYRDGLAAGLADAIREYRASLETNPLDGSGT